MSMRVKIGRGAFCAAILLFLATVCFFVSLFRLSGQYSRTVAAGQEYFFLVRDCEATTAGAVAGDAYLAGGAGYLIEEENAVVLACYYSREDAEYVSGVMAEKGVGTTVLSRKAEAFTLKGSTAGEKARVEANLKTADACAKILFDTANALERAEIAQEGARAAVRGVAKSLAGLRAENESGVFSLWNVELERAERRAKELKEGILFARDLRYLQVQLCFAVLQSPSYFI